MMSLNPATSVLLVCLAFAAVHKTVSEVDVSFLDKCSHGGYIKESAAENVTLTNVLEVTTQFRSMMECSGYCWKLPLCIHAHFSHQGECILTTFEATLRTHENFYGTSTQAPRPLTGTTTCEELKCPGDCIYSCRNGGEPSAYCLVDASSCESITQISNLVHYYSPEKNDNTDEGNIQKFLYTKREEYTGVRVQMYLTLRGHYGAQGCTRWAILFNGTECEEPGKIEFVDYETVAVNDHRMAEIQGICEDLPAGTIELSLSVGTCGGYTSVMNSYTAYLNPIQIMVSEVDGRADKDKTCDGLSMYNTDQDTYKVQINSDDYGTVLKEMTVNKTSHDTGLYIQYFAAMRIYAKSSTLYYCARCAWYLSWYTSRACDSESSAWSMLCSSEWRPR